MLRDNNMMDKYDDMIAEMYDCVRLGGFGTSVTPVSQFYAQQAIQNVMFGKFKKFAPGYAKMVLGYFGKTPVPPDPEIVKKASEFMASSDLNKAYSQPTTKTVLEMNDADPKKGGKVAKKMLEDAGLPVTDENIFIAASCKEKGILFLKDYYGAADRWIYQYLKVMQGALLASGKDLWIYDSPISHKEGMLRPQLIKTYDELFDRAKVIRSP